MLCTACKRPLRPLFTSLACDYCDGLAQVSWLSGFIVFRGEEDFSRPVYVFPTRTDAAMYRQLKRWQAYPIREIRFEHPVRWKLALGNLQDVTLAARPFELFRDHRFPSTPYAGFLVPIAEPVVAASNTGR